MNDKRTTPLPFKLVTEEELMNDMYVDIPSDLESITPKCCEGEIEEEPKLEIMNL